MKTQKEEKIIFIREPRKDFKFLDANRHTKPAHVRSLMGAMERGEWIPPIFVTKDGYVVDGQNRYKAFCNICENNPSHKLFLRVLIITSDEDPVQLAIRFNSGQKRWLAADYFHAYTTLEIDAYIKLADFISKTQKHLKGVRAAVQIIKGAYSSSVFKEGKLQITYDELVAARFKMMMLHKVYMAIKDDRVFKRDVILAFYNVFDDIKDKQKFLKNLQSKFLAPKTDRCKDWTAAYRMCL